MNIKDHSVLKRFVKDYSLPIQVLQKPYFEYFLDLYNDVHKTRERIELLEQSIEKCGGEDKFMHQYYVIRDNIIKTIEQTEAYKQYNSEKMDKFLVEKRYPKKDVFNESNDGKYFISIDLVKANFQAMKYFSKDIVLGCDSYEELIGRFTDLDYMKKSKYIRQVIFGNMNPKRQIRIEEFLTSKVLDYVISLLGEENIRMVSPDEIVAEIPDITKWISNERYLAKRATELLAGQVKEDIDIDVDIEIYQLKQLKPFKYFVKEFINKDGFELMCIPIVYHAQVFKHYLGLPLEDNDLLFFYENRVARFVESLDFNGQALEEIETDN